MTYSGNEISYMDYRSHRGYNNYDRYNYTSAAYEIDLERRRKEEERRELEEARRKKLAALERSERRANVLKGIQLVAAAGVLFLPLCFIA